MKTSGFVVLIALIYLSTNNVIELKGAQSEGFDSERKLNILKVFCEGKIENFCSPQSLYYMLLILNLEREKEEKLKKLKLDQTKVNKFFENHPRFKFWRQILIERPFK